MGPKLDAFNDILRGGFGTPEGGFVLRWARSEISRKNLSYPETVGSERSGWNAATSAVTTPKIISNLFWNDFRFLLLHGH